MSSDDQDDGEDRSEDDGENRSMHNRKGQSELSALKELGFRLDYDGYSIEAGIRKYWEYRKGKLKAVDLGKYGLEETDTQGHKVLYLSSAAVQELFGQHVHGYADPKLWQKKGPICQKAERVTTPKLKNAIDFFKESLAMRQLRVDPADGRAYPLHSFLKEYGQDEGQRRWATARPYTGGDRGHENMRANIEACVTALEECYRIAEARVADAAARRVADAAAQERIAEAGVADAAALLGGLNLN
jgi:hypothetical protein